ncbi:hypothetical protein [Akkermansia sp.]|uniref:hypothetical protein n=1 Tax=Akkermansia sp. TaxID=1872421 RepID=UPI0025C20219|nr:hypothetical protein [Akkermansia sp.]MCC8149545.1 hypothetical protein [Akkermansia sp.]
MKIIIIFLNLFLSLPLLAQLQEKVSQGQSMQVHLRPPYRLFTPWLTLGGYKGSAVIGYSVNADISSPPSDVQRAIKSVTSPVKNAFLTYKKLHNKTVDENSYLSDGIAWSYMIIRFHQDKSEDMHGAITAWSTGASGSDYYTVGAFKNVSRACIGKWSKSKEDAPMKVSWKIVGKDGETPDKEGYECFAGTLDPDNYTIDGQWVAYASHLQEKMRHQSGSMKFTSPQLLGNSYSFEMNKITRDPTWDKKKVKQIINDYNRIADIFGSGCFPYFLSHEEQEQIVAYYVHEAWKYYAEDLPSDIKSSIESHINKDENNIFNFKVNLGNQFFSDSKRDNNGYRLPVPMQYHLQSPWILNISTGTFLTDMVENEKQSKSRLSLIAHEILGHGIFHRYYSEFIKKISTKIEHEKNISTPEANTAASEGLAVAVEYAVYQKENGNKHANISEFVQCRYVNTNGKQAAMYKLGVEFLIQEGIINKEGKLDFSKINN